MKVLRIPKISKDPKLYMIIQRFKSLSNFLSHFLLRMACFDQNCFKSGTKHSIVLCLVKKDGWQTNQLTGIRFTYKYHFQRIRDISTYPPSLSCMILFLLSSEDVQSTKTLRTLGLGQNFLILIKRCVRGKIPVRSHSTEDLRANPEHNFIASWVCQTGCLIAPVLV